MVKKMKIKKIKSKAKVARRPVKKAASARPTLKKKVVKSAANEGAGSSTVAGLYGEKYALKKMPSGRLVLVPEEDYRAIMALLEDKADVEAFDQAIANSEEAVPADIANRIIDGENPIKVYREWRGFTQSSLAKAVDSKPAYISQMETGVRDPSVAMLREMSNILNVSIDDLVD